MSSIAPAPLRLALLLGTSGLCADARLLLSLIEPDERFELVALLEMSRTRSTLLSRILRGPSRRTLATMLLSWIGRAEKVLRGERGTRGAQAPLVGLSAVQRIVVPGYDGDAASHNPEWKEIRTLGLDAVVDLDGVGIARHFAGAAQFGCWSVTYLGEPAGFWEVYFGLGVTTATLQIASRQQQGDSRPIATARFTTRMSFTKNSSVVRDGAVTLLWRELKKLYSARRLPPPLDGPPKLLHGPPTVAQALRYGSIIAGRTWKALVKSPLEDTSGRWRLFVGSGSYEQASWSDASETPPPAGEYWADPFLFRRADDVEPLIFFEVFEDSTNKGKISVGRVSNDKVVYIGDALVTPYHLSYPFVFAHDGEVWMIPETHHTCRIELWKCISYPLEWRLEKTVLHGRSVADSSICHHNGSWWLFTNHASSAGDHNSELHVYKIDSPMMGEITPHRCNPVVIDATRARNGGRMHVSNGSLMRPAQDNSYRYGYGLSVYRIRTLTLDEYEEEPAFRVEPGFRPGILACHHLDFAGDMFVFDACRDRSWDEQGKRALLGHRKRRVV